jgi:hypothetical protein
MQESLRLNPFTSAANSSQRRAALRRVYLYVDLLFVGVALAALLYRYYAAFAFPSGTSGDCKYVDYTSLGMYWQTSRDLVGILLILLYLKAMRFMMLVSGMGVAVGGVEKRSR